MSTGDDADDKARKILERMRNEGRATYTTRIDNSVIGAVAVGDGAKAVGTVHVGGSAQVPRQARASIDTGTDFVIVTTIDVERRAMCAALGFDDKSRIKKDGRWYWRGKLPLAGGESYTITVAQPADMGQLEAALLATKAMEHWKPNSMLLVGVAATTKPDVVALGDVVVGRSIYYYEHGKVTADGTRAQPEMVMADAHLLQHFVGMADWDGHVAEVRPDGLSRKPKVHQGVIASGEKVIASAAARDAIAAGHRKILALEMEGYGFGRALWHQAEKVRHLDIRGICDDASDQKDDRWHQYAAAAAAGFVRHFLQDRPVDPIETAD